MQNSDNAKKGFKTFILTLSVSLIIFSVVYYFMTNNGSSSDSDLLSDTSSVTDKVTEDADVVSPFGQIAAKKPSTSEFSNVPAVLAGTTVGVGTTTPGTSIGGTTTGTTGVTTTVKQSTVPVTGTMDITIGLIVSSLIFAAAVFWNKLNPRKFALAGFEKKVLEDYSGEVRYTRKYTRYY